MKIGDVTEFKDRKGKTICIGDKLKFKDGRKGTVFYSGTVQVGISDDEFMAAPTVVTIGIALNNYKGVKVKEM